MSAKVKNPVKKSTDVEKAVQRKPIYLQKSGKLTKYMELDSSMLVRYIYLDKVAGHQLNDNLIVVNGERTNKTVTLKTQRLPIGIMLGQNDMGKVKYVVAFCSPKESFSRKKALQIAMGRYYAKYRMGRYIEYSEDWNEISQIPSKYKKGVIGNMVKSQVSNFIQALERKSNG